MGWMRDGYGDHEGWAVAYVERDGCSRGSGLFRELQFPGDSDDRRVAMIGAGCDCGWRSSRFAPSKPARWAPFSPLLCDDDDERVRALWSGHLAHVKTA